MAVTVYQPWNPGLLKSPEEEDTIFDKVPACVNFMQHEAITDTFCVHDLLSPASIREKPSKTRLGPSQSPAHPLKQLLKPPNHISHEKLSSFVSLLKTCARKKDLHTGMRVHDEIATNGLLDQCAAALITMYAKCDALTKARELLDTHRIKNISAWTALIAGYTRNGQGEEALKCFDNMQHQGLSPDAVTFACILKACGSTRSVDMAEQIHLEIARQGLLNDDVVLGNSLIDMYVKCGNLSKAQQVLDELRARDVVSWSTLIAGYAQQGNGELAVKSFEQMQCEGLLPNVVTFASILKAFGTIGAMEKGKQIHNEISKQGLLKDNIVLGNSLVDMYAKCGALVKARQVLEELPHRDIISWNILIAGYVQHDQCENALHCMEWMLRDGLFPNAVSYICVLKACGVVGALDKGKQLHDQIVRQGLLRNNIMLGTALIDMYAKCGDLGRAQHLLEELPFRDVVSWNALITGYVQQGRGEEAFQCLNSMQCDGVSPDAVTFARILSACGTMRALDKGKHIHDEIAKQGLLKYNMSLGSSLVDMYAKCGNLTKAHHVLRQLPLQDVVSWSALISGYVQNGHGEDAISCFQQMQAEGLSPNPVTYACVLKACAIIGALDQGEQIHDAIAREGLLGSNNALGNALVDMYANCGSLVKAHEVLKELPSRDVVSWNALVAGYLQNNEGEKALNCVDLMRQDGFDPDTMTFACMLKACGAIGAFDKGEEICDEIGRRGLLGNDAVLGTALVDMYAKCGSLARAAQVLEQLPCRDATSWNALITGYAKEGQGQQALNCLERMQREGHNPTAVTFSGILSSCSHLGLIGDGYMHFANMTKYGIEPTVKHFTCMVDLFGRAGNVDKAIEVIFKMPYRSYSGIWGALLGACQKWGDRIVGLWAFEQALQADKSDGTAYALMANIYAAANLQEDLESIEVTNMGNKA